MAAKLVVKRVSSTRARSDTANLPAAQREPQNIKGTTPPF